MPQGDKDLYTEKQKRQAEHIEESYEEKHVPEKKAKAIAWATVNKIYGGGNRKGGSGEGHPINKEPMKKGGRLGGRSAARSRSARAKKTSGGGVHKGRKPKQGTTATSTRGRRGNKGHAAEAGSPRKRGATRSTRSAHH